VNHHRLGSIMETVVINSFSLLVLLAVISRGIDLGALVGFILISLLSLLVLLVLVLIIGPSPDPVRT